MNRNIKREMRAEKEALKTRELILNGRRKY